MASGFAPMWGLTLPSNEVVTQGIAIYTQAVSLILLTFIFAGTTVLYYRARAKEEKNGS